MLYAKVVFGLPVEGPFDYIVPAGLQPKIKTGCRVRVHFVNRRKVGYVVGLARSTRIARLKPLLELLDEAPLLDKPFLALTKEVAAYYCCSWGESIETGLPKGLRDGKQIQGCISGPGRPGDIQPQPVLLVVPSDESRWLAYQEEIKKTLANERSVLILVTDKESAHRMQERLKRSFQIDASVLTREEPNELEVWMQCKKGQVQVLIGTRSCIFVPLPHLGLVIINDEHDSLYKQEQAPHYHARQAALMRAKLQKALLVMASHCPSLETMELVRRGILAYKVIAEKKPYPQIKILSTKASLNRSRQKDIISKYLYDIIISIINDKGKILVYVNRKGYATCAYCGGCQVVLKCPRCNVNLAYYYKNNILKCNYCNYTQQSTAICPNCNSNYIRYSGLGSERIASEFARLVPGARIKRHEELKDFDVTDVDICVATQSSLRHGTRSFDAVVVLSIDNMLNRVDFRATEKTYNLLTDLLRFTEKKIFIQSNLATHHCFRALVENNPSIFYETEFNQRRLSGFPPFKHIGLVKIRGKNEQRVKQSCQAIFGGLSSRRDRSGVRVVAAGPGQPEKLRGNFCWQIIVKGGSALKLSAFLKSGLKKLPHSGIIVTVDVDPM